MGLVFTNFKGAVDLQLSEDAQLIFSLKPTTNLLLNGIWLNLQDVHEDLYLSLLYGSVCFKNYLVKIEDPRKFFIPGSFPLSEEFLLKANGTSKVKISYEYFIQGLGVGNLWTYALTDSRTGLPIANASITVCVDPAGKGTIAEGITDSQGEFKARLSPGTYYVFRKCLNYLFEDPDVEVVT